MMEQTYDELMMGHARLMTQQESHAQILSRLMHADDTMPQSLRSIYLVALSYSHATEVSDAIQNERKQCAILADSIGTLNIGEPPVELLRAWYATGIKHHLNATRQVVAQEIANSIRQRGLCK